MSDHSPIIDVDPVASTSDAARGARPSEGDAFRAPSYGKGAAQAAVNATIIDGGTGAKRKPSRIGAVQTAVGGALMLVGVPMLILPGPGLLAIGGGAVIAAGGVKKMRGK